MKTLRSLTLLFCVASFTIIAYFVTSGSSLVFDQSMMEAVVSLRQNWLTRFFTPFTHTGDWQFIVLVCCVLLMFRRTRKAYGYPMAGSAIISVSLYQALKFIFQRPRPDVLHLIDQGGYSFPSGHSLTSLVFCGTLLLLLHQHLIGSGKTIEKRRESPLPIPNKALFWTAFVVFSSYILLMGLSRIYLGVHYPTDVAASWLLGTCLLIWTTPMRRVSFKD